MNSLQKIEHAIDDIYARHDLPGLAVGVKVGADSPLADAGIDISSVRGHSDFEGKAPLKANAVFHMASVAKLFVATCVMQLYAASRLDIDAPLVEYLPWFRMDDPRYTAITVRQVLSHTAGIPDIRDYHWTEPEIDRSAPRRFITSAEVTAPPLLWNPGAGGFSYSNIGYDILGALIAEVSGETFESYVETHIFAKLGMRDSTFSTFLRTPEGRALAGEQNPSAGEVRAALSPVRLHEYGVVIPHRKNANRRVVRQAYYPYHRAHAPSSTLTSTLRDIKRWGDAHIEGWDGLEPNAYEQMWHGETVIENNNERMSLGWFLREQNGYRLYGHEGADDGFRSSFWICPALKTQITVLINIDRPSVKKFNKQLFDLLTNRR
ncbi:MAG: beta-lactamase family protein [Clostridiales Family XIII bacterium]|nr:beta-lactamase family protein [Clostridiales Family XIII bacterium]